MSDKDFEDIYDFLKKTKFDLGSEELRTVRTLLKLKEGSAKEIADESRLQVPKVYGALKNLIKHGVVTKVRERPARFRPVVPEEIEAIVTDVMKDADKLTQEYKEYYKAGFDAFSVEPTYEIIENRERFYRKAMQMVRFHPKEIFMISRRGAFYRWIPKKSSLDKRDDEDPLTRELGERYLREYLDRKGSKVYALISKTTPPEHTHMAKNSYPKRFEYHLIDREYRGVSAMVCDDRVLLGWSRAGPTGLTTGGLYIESPAIYQFIRAMFLISFGQEEKV